MPNRRERARAVAGFIPDCAILFGRLARDPRVATRQKLVLGTLVVYLALPFDLIPDFIPVAGHLDDALVVLLALRGVVRRTDIAIVREHWPGPEGSLDALVRLVS